MFKYTDEDIIYSFFCKLMQEYNLNVVISVDPETNKAYDVFRTEDLNNSEANINYQGFSSLRRNNGINRYL